MKSIAELKYEKLMRLRSLAVQIGSTGGTEKFWKYRHDPVAFAADVLNVRLYGKQEEVLWSVVENKRTTVRSCHAAGKSFTAGGILIPWWLSVHPVGEAFAVSTAPTFRQVMTILWREINRSHRIGRLPGRVNQTSWWMPHMGGEQIVGYGAKPPSHDEHAFQGIHAPKVLVVLDEADGVPPTLWTAAEAITTSSESRILAIGNPYDPTGNFARTHDPESQWNKVRIRAWDTPNFTGEDVGPEAQRVLLSPEWVEEMAEEWGRGSPLWQSRIEAEFPTDATDTVIPLAWVIEAMNRELPAGGPKVLGVDVARFGDDETSIYLREGGRIREYRTTWHQDTMTTAGWVTHALMTTPAEVAHVDADGLGGGVVDRLKEEGRAVRSMHSGGSPVEKERFVNTRAEWWWGLRKKFENGEVDIDPDDQKLIGQLTSIKYTVRPGSGQIIIESKEDMKKRGLSSPDRADAVMLAFARESGQTDPQTEEALRGASFYG